MDAAQPASPDSQSLFQLDEPTGAWLVGYWIAFLLFVPLGFALFPVGLLLMPLVTIGWLVHASRFTLKRRAGWFWLWAAVPFVVVPAFCIANAFVGYWTGGALLKSGGIGEQLILMPDAGNLDRKLRAYHAIDGIQAPIYPFTGLPNNLVLRGMCFVLGPVHGTYHGPYPTKQQASDLLAKQGQSVAEAAFKSGSFSLNGTALQFSPELLAQLRHETPAGHVPYEGGYDGGDVIAVLQDPGCLIVRYTNSRKYTIAALIDLAHQRVFARYLLD
jgi:hypothetical protein